MYLPSFAVDKLRPEWNGRSTGGELRPSGRLVSPEPHAVPAPGLCRPSGACSHRRARWDRSSLAGIECDFRSARPRIRLLDAAVPGREAGNRHLDQPDAGRILVLLDDEHGHLLSQPVGNVRGGGHHLIRSFTVKLIVGCLRRSDRTCDSLISGQRVSSAGAWYGHPDRLTVCRSTNRHSPCGTVLGDGRGCYWFCFRERRDSGL